MIPAGTSCKVSLMGICVSTRDFSGVGSTVSRQGHFDPGPCSALLAGLRLFDREAEAIVVVIERELGSNVAL